MTLVRRIDAVTLLRTDAAEVTGEGFRIYDALFARTGIQVYDDGRGGLIREYRPDAEVFDGASLASYELRPLTDLHPPGNVTTDTAKVLARGAVSAARAHADGRHVAGRLAVWDADLIAKFDQAEARGDAMQLSAGYTLDLDPTPGTTPDGERYDAIQRGIRINHVAAVPLGRAGSARVLTDAADLVGALDLGIAGRLDGIRPNSRVIVDMGRWARRDAADLRTQTHNQAPPAKETATTMTIKTNIDGKPVELELADDATPQQIADAVAKAHADAKTDMAPPFGKKKPEDEDEEEMDGKDKKSDAVDVAEQIKAAREDALAVADVLGTARAICGIDYPARADAHAIRLDVVAAVLGDDERKAIESLPKADQAGATAYAYARAVKAHADRPTHADNLLTTIRQTLAQRADASTPNEDPIVKARKEAADRARYHTKK